MSCLAPSLTVDGRVFKLDLLIQMQVQFIVSLVDGQVISAGIIAFILIEKLSPFSHPRVYGRLHKCKVEKGGR